MEKGKVISTAESVGSKEGRGGKLSRLRGVAKETGCGNESLNRTALTPEPQISHTWEGLGCWYSTLPPPALDPEHPVSHGLPAPPPRPRVKTSFFSAHLWTGLPAPSSTHSATGPGASEPMKAQGAPSRDRTVQELDALPPRCHLWDKHLQNTRRVPAAPAGWCGYG